MSCGIVLTGFCRTLNVCIMLTVLLCVSRTCGIVHCYAGGSGFYRDPNDVWKGFPVERMYVNPSKTGRDDPKYVLQTV